MIRYDNKGVLLHDLFAIRGSVAPKSLMVALPSAFLGLAISILNLILTSSDDDENLKDQIASGSLKASQLWAAMSAALAFMIFFRTNKAYGRFWDGTTLLHQMWGEWFDAVSCLIAFSHTARKTKPHEVAEFRHTLVRLMSLCHASALDEIAQSEGAPTGYECIDVGGLDQNTLKWLKECKYNKHLNFNRVEVLIHMIQNLIVVNQEIGAIKIPPPILSRVFQTLSRGQVNLMNCKKIVHTLFPFPYAQVISWLIIAFSIATPLVMAAIIEQPHWVFCFTFLPVFGLVSLNYVAVEIEMPFGDDPNDLPLDDFQDHMNNSMLMLISDQSDICPHLSDHYARDFESIKKTISKKRPKDFIENDDDTSMLPRPSYPLSATPFEEPKVASPKATQLQPAPAQSPSQPPIAAPPPAKDPPAKDAEANLIAAALPAFGGIIEALKRSCDELVAHASTLSWQMSLNTEAFKQMSMTLAKDGTLSRI